MSASDKQLRYEIFPWNDNFSVGIEFIDQQHQRLVDLLNNAIWQLISGKDKRHNKLVVQHLLNYARYHFHEEEALWRKYFPSEGIAKDHYKTHADFFVKVRSLTEDSSEGGSSDKLIGYLTNWLAVHIIHSDRIMATMVKLIDSGLSFAEAERHAKQKVNQTRILRSSIIDLYHKLSGSAAELIREKDARLKAETHLQNLLKQQAEQALDDQAREYQGYLEFLAYNDPETGLLNRNGLMKHLKQLMTKDKDKVRPFAVASIDIDYFSQISAQLTTDGADRMLGILARRWEDALLPNGTLAHLGGDDFVAIIREIDLLDSQLKAFSLTASQPFKIDEWCGAIQFTAGVALYSADSPRNGNDPEKLLRQADYALYQAKQVCRGNYRIFDAKEEQERAIRNNKLAEIRLAIQENQFEVYYQPKVNMVTGDIIGAEALIRWNHPDHGLTLPGEFLPYLEHHPLVIELDEWVIKQVLEQLVTWKESGLTPVISVNIDTYHMQTENFYDRTKAILDQYPEPVIQQLEFEILETTAINDLDIVISNINRFRQLGISFSLDDFGTGYCSLSYLKKIPVETLKIDQAYIRDLLENVTNISILEGIIAIAKTFHLKVIAEGVESTQHGEFLIQLGCQLAQGYAIARPLPAGDLVKWTDRWKTNPQWAQSCPLRRDDILALTGLAELNSQLSQLKNNNISVAQFIKRDCFHSESLERWVATNLETRPVTDINTVHKIEDTYKNLIKLGDRIVRVQKNTPGTSHEDILLNYKNTLQHLTEQIRAGLSESVAKRHQRRHR